MHHLTRKLLWLTMIALVPVIGACDSSDPVAGLGDGASGAVSLSVTVPVTTSASFAPGAALFDVVQNDSTNELVLTSVTLVLREVELERQNEDDCDDHMSGADDSCEEFSSGPMLLPLPLDGSVDYVVAINDVPADTYDEVEFEIHKLESDSPADMDFINANPDFADVSIRTEGTFNGNPFVFLSDLSQDQEYDLVPPLVVDGSASAVNLTLSIDVTTWFVAPDGTLIDPETANKGGANERLVTENIKRSIDVYEDHDRDGHEDLDEGDQDHDRNGHDDSDDGSDDSSDDS